MALRSLHQRMMDTSSITAGWNDPVRSQSTLAALDLNVMKGHTGHPPITELLLLVFEAVLEVVCVSLPGYIIARMGMFDAEMQKFVANLNVMLFTPCLIFTKLASQLTLEKMADLAIIPVIFIVMTAISYLSALIVSKVCRFSKRPRNFLIAMAVFGNSNSLPISLVVSLSKTLPGLRWNQVPKDNSSEVAARGILYLLIFQQLGQLLRWSWGYNVLLAPPETYAEETAAINHTMENGERYRDDPEDDLSSSPRSRKHNHLINSESNGTLVGDSDALQASRTESDFESGGITPVNRYEASSETSSVAELEPTPIKKRPTGFFEARNRIHSFPRLDSSMSFRPANSDPNPNSLLRRVSSRVQEDYVSIGQRLSSIGSKIFAVFPRPIQTALSWIGRVSKNFFRGLWAFMNPPLWAMLVSIIIASIPALQRFFFTKGSFVENSITNAIGQSAGVAVPLILVVLGANLARNTLPQDSRPDLEEQKIEKKLLIASIVARMVIPTILMSPLLALTAKFVPVSILDDPIFVVVMFLLVGAPSALQLAQICQLNNVYQGVMANILFQSYVIWIMPSTLILVGLALEVVEWAT